MSDISVSVVIACHDLRREAAIVGAVRSAQQQIGMTVPTVPIVLAVDHNEALSAAMRERLPEVRVVDNDTEFRGASGTRNVGARAAHSEFLAFLDDDEIAEPDWLVTLMSPFAEPDVVGTGGRYLPEWDVRRPNWFPDELAWVVGGHHTGMPDDVARVRNVWSGNMAVRANIFDKVGGFRTDFGKVGGRSRPEDTDLCIRMAASTPGGHWMYVPEARIRHAVPRDRSSFAFYLRRCWAEGKGKVELQTSSGDPATLDVERDYLRRTIPLGVRHHLVDAASALGRAGAIVAGIGTAGIGAAVARVQEKKRSGR